MRARLGVLTQPSVAHRNLGGHLKTGHGWTLQKRPTELSRDKSSYTLSRAVGANFFRDPGRRVCTSDTWAEDTATQGCDQSADPGAGMRGRRTPPLMDSFWRESDKSRVREGSALAVKNEESLLPYDAAAVLVRQLRGPHLSTWP